MTDITTPLRTLPPRDLRRAPRWAVGDALTADGKRWMIRALNAKTGAVYLVAANTTNHGIGWATTLDKLPEKTA